MSANPPAGAESERTGQPFLLYRDADGRERSFPFEAGQPQATVGRRQGSDLLLDWDDQVSRLHARFERDADGWTLVDDGLSRNGTFVNGERVSGRRRLHDGDTLRFGTTTMTFRSPAVVEQPAAVPVGEVPAATDLSSTQRRVLVALCRPYKGGNSFAIPADDEAIAKELFLSVGAVKTHLAVLFAKFGIEGLAPDQMRVRLVQMAFQGGLVSERDL